LVFNEETGNVRVYELNYMQRLRLVAFGDVCARSRQWGWRLWAGPDADPPDVG
jgi:hypothetical protein